MKNNLGELFINEELEESTNSSALSMYDLFSCAEFKNAHHSEDWEEVGKLLFSVGVDLSKGLYIVNRLHRPLCQIEIVFGGVLLYIERLDAEWIKSGAASMEAVVKSTGDYTVRADIMKMQDAYMTLEKVKEIHDRGIE